LRRLGVHPCASLPRPTVRVDPGAGACGAHQWHPAPRASDAATRPRAPSCGGHMLCPHLARQIALQRCRGQQHRRRLSPRPTAGAGGSCGGRCRATGSPAAPRRRWSPARERTGRRPSARRSGAPGWPSSSGCATCVPAVVMLYFGWPQDRSMRDVCRFGRVPAGLAASDAYRSVPSSPG
jgi:hypothetical protein